MNLNLAVNFILERNSFELSGLRDVDLMMSFETNGVVYYHN